MTVIETITPITRRYLDKKSKADLIDMFMLSSTQHDKEQKIIADLQAQLAQQRMTPDPAEADLWVCERQPQDIAGQRFHYQPIRPYTAPPVTEGNGDVIKLIDARIKTYCHKHEYENGSDKTKAELRFAIGALEMLKGDVLSYAPQPPADVSEDEKAALAEMPIKGQVYSGVITKWFDDHHVAIRAMLTRAKSDERVVADKLAEREV